MSTGLIVVSAAPIEIAAVAEPLSHQVASIESSARFKVLRAGRRWGKTREAEYCAIIGHGPIDDSGEPLFPGIASGRGDVVWVLPNFMQRNAIWDEEIVPRFEGSAGCRVDRTRLYLELPNRGRLYIRSVDQGALRTIRGLGKRVIGLVIDEAAHLDLQTAWQQVLRWILIDNEAWALFSSTTNAGGDGHIAEDGTKRTPSYFNIICQEILAGERGPEWAHWHGTAYDNPRLSRSEIDAALTDFAKHGQRTLDEEFWAKLLKAGAGVAFPEWDEDIHVADWQPEKEPERYQWSWFGDWGYTSPGGCWLVAQSRDRKGRALVRMEYYFSRTDPVTAGYNWGMKLLRFPRPDYGIMDHPAVADGGPTILERFYHGMAKALGDRLPPPAWAPVKSSGAGQPKGYRQTAKLMVHEMLFFERAADGAVPEWDRPFLTVHKDCSHLARCMGSIQVDPRGLPDVDTDGEDHAYDALKDWGMATRGPQAAALWQRLRGSAATGPPDPDEYRYRQPARKVALPAAPAERPWAARWPHNGDGMGNGNGNGHGNGEGEGEPWKNIGW